MRNAVHLQYNVRIFNGLTHRGVVDTCLTTELWHVAAGGDAMCCIRCRGSEIGDILLLKETTFLPTQTILHLQSEKLN